MITQFKKALYISTSILLTNAFVFNSNAETSTAADIMSGIANIANAVSTANNQQENNSTEGQSVISDAISDVAAAAEQAQEPVTPEMNVDNAVVAQDTKNATEQSSETVTPTAEQVVPTTQIETVPPVVEQVIPTAQAETAAVREKTGFIDQNGNILIAPEGTVFPSEMKDGEIYYFSRDVEKAKENIKNNTIPQIIPGSLPQNGFAPNANDQQFIPSNTSMNGGIIPGQIPQMNPNFQPQNGLIPGTNGQQFIPSNTYVNGGMIPGKMPQVNPNPQPQNGLTPGTNGQQVIPSYNPMNRRVIPGKMPQVNPNTQPQNALTPGASGQQVAPSYIPMNGRGIPGQLPQNQNVQPTKTQEEVANFDIDKENKKPIMFQCYLA